MARLGSIRELAARFALVRDETAERHRLELELQRRDLELQAMRDEVAAGMHALGLDIQAGIARVNERLDAVDERLDVVVDEAVRRAEADAAELRGRLDRLDAPASGAADPGPG